VVKYQDPNNDDKCTAKFLAYHKQFRLDFEAFLKPVGDDDCDNDDEHSNRGSRIVEEHEVCGFACHRVTDIAEYQIDPVVYSGSDVMAKFYDHVTRESNIISEML